MEFNVLFFFGKPKQVFTDTHLSLPDANRPHHSPPSTAEQPTANEPAERAFRGADFLLFFLVDFIHQSLLVAS